MDELFISMIEELDADSHLGKVLDVCSEWSEQKFAGIEGGKIFLNPEKVYMHEGKIYVETEEGPISIPEIYSDESGLFLIAGGRISPRPMWICKKCTLAHYYQLQECERYGGTSFIVRFK